jgi:hypothetical protein
MASQPSFHAARLRVCFRLCLLLIASAGAGCGRKEAGQIAVGPSQASVATTTAGDGIRFEDVIVRSEGGADEPLPAADGGLTVVNLFDEFSSECASGVRMETLRAVASGGGGLRTVAVFSDEKFSPQDVRNMRLILDPPFPLLRGKVDKSRAALPGGSLLVVFDSEKRVVWAERPGMSEADVQESLARLVAGRS